MDATTELERAREAIRTAIKRREAAGQSVEEIAREFGTGRATLYRWSQGKFPRVAWPILRLVREGSGEMPREAA